ncbi:RAD55 family ATPase [Halorubrum sp. DTA98]|uniref:RAD55 family ATPase n=1 Tax=Halorubrum sp. DTA98 TaxID=3402163 RepID=UPI003AAD72A1
MDRLATGVSVLDRQLDGGLPIGSVVVLKAEPASQSELFLNTFTSVRETLYLTTVRSADAVADGFERSTTRVGEPTIRSIAGDVSLDNAAETVSSLSERSTLVVDSLAPLEGSDPVRYRRFLEELRSHVRETESIAVLHALKRGTPSGNRVVSQQIADVVFDLRTTKSGTEIVNRLGVPKFRGGAALEETMKLKLSDTVAVDTSRDIA